MHSRRDPDPTKAAEMKEERPDPEPGNPKGSISPVRVMQGDFQASDVLFPAVVLFSSLFSPPVPKKMGRF